VTTAHTAGRFYGIGLGPGDPELISLKAARIIGESDVVAYHAGVNKQSYARTIAADLIPADAIEEELRYPLTTGTTDHPGGYAGALADFYEQSAARLAAHLTAGRTVALLAEGDPLFYGSFMYMHDRLSTRFATEVIPGIPAFAAATAITASPLVRQTDVLTVLPGTLPETELARRLADTDGAIIMKLGRTFPAVRRALAAAGRLEHALYVERASHPQQRWLPAADVDESTVPYLSLIVVNGDSLNGRRSRVAVDEPRRASLPTETGGAELLVIGLGPGPDSWMTPEAAAVTVRTWRGCLSGKGCSGTHLATPSKSTARASPSNWPFAARRSPLSPAATQEFSAWPRQCSRPLTTSASPRFPSGCCPPSRPFKPSRHGPAHPSGRTSR
jgi:precorrin-2 C20-methyltransferase/precorrin-3B C17-methyltransferase